LIQPTISHNFAKITQFITLPNAFDKIGRRYDSKTAFEKKEDPFDGRRFCYYSNRKENKTVFVENMSVKSK